MWDVRAVSDLDIRPRASLSEMLETLVDAGASILGEGDLAVMLSDGKERRKGVTCSEQDLFPMGVGATPVTSPQC